MFEFLGIVDILSFLGWLTLFSIIAYLVYVYHKHKPEYKYYLTHFYFKIILAFCFGLVYMFYYEKHGDTVFYWQGAKALNQLFFYDPIAYLNELFSSGRNVIPTYYEQAGLTPPSWIYSEENSWFVCKLANFLSFFSFGSYMTLNLFFSVIVAWVSWRFFRFSRKILNSDSFLVVIACLFIPTTAFWCTGVSKDAIILCSVYGTVMSFFTLLSKEKKSFLIHVFVLLICMYLLFQVRPFMLLITYFPLFIILTFRINKDKPAMVRFLSRLIGISITLAITTLYFTTSNSMLEFSADKILNSASVIQNDLTYNAGYTGARYDLGITNFTTLELIEAIPGAIIASLYRPFLWEVSNPMMVLNGIENVLLMFLTIQLLWRFKFKKKMYRGVNSDFYIYALIFSLLLAYIVGVTSVLFGVLVRFKAPIIPFFLLYLISKKRHEKIESEFK